MPNNNSRFKNDWTLMFFFASDNRLAPLLVSELKAIKDAGFQEDTEVLVYYDPLEKGCPTKIYNVNNERKARRKNKNKPKSEIGDGNDSYVRKMDEDEVDPKNFSARMRDAMASSTVPAHEMLGYFVDYVTTRHKARNYMLFLIGHGMIVGRDIFLPDDDPVSAVSMSQLQQIMKKFVHGGKTSLQLLCLHSCSMSSIEVAYQLRGTANYMMAHQGPAFVNSWNYRQVLKKIFNTIDTEKRQIDVQRLIEKLYYHCLHNATDFLSAGYSADLALYSLQKDKLARIRTPIQLLVQRLKENLPGVKRKDNLPGRSIIKDLILLAHWESQSFWEENYTDLYDFCFCLSRRCNDAIALYGKKGLPVSKLNQVRVACDGVIKVLSIIKSDNRAARFRGLIIHAGNFGTKYQYARGLSIYFPWCEPLDDEPWTSERQNGQSRSKPKGRNQKIIEGYKSYDFNKGVNSWWSFLDSYFKETKRASRWKENPQELTVRGARRLLSEAISEFNVDGSLGTRTPDVGTRTPDTGLDCTCPTIKNYPTDEKKYTIAEKKSRTAKKKSRTAKKKHLIRKVRKFSITPDALRAFRPDVTEDNDTGG